MLNRGDFIRVVDCEDLKEELEDALVGEEGVIIGVDSKYRFPYEVVFFNKKKQRIARDNSVDLWREEDLQRIE